MKKVLFTLGLVALAGVMVACGGTSSSVTPSTSSGEPSVSSPSAPSTPSTSVTPSTPSTTTPVVSGPTTVAEYDFAEFTGESTKVSESNVNDYLTQLNAQSDTDTDLTSLSDYNTVYFGIERNLKGDGILKFSSSSQNGTLTFNFPEGTNITAVQVYGAGWRKDNPTLTVGDAEAQNIESIPETTAEDYIAGCKTYTFNLTEGTNSIAFTATKRVMISKLTFITK